MFRDVLLISCKSLVSVFMIPCERLETIFLIILESLVGLLLFIFIIVFSHIIPDFALDLCKKSLSCSLGVLITKLSLCYFNFLYHITVLFLQDLVCHSVLADCLLLRLSLDAIRFVFRFFVVSRKSLSLYFNIFTEHLNPLNEFLPFLWSRPRSGWRSRTL